MPLLSMNRIITSCQKCSKPIRSFKKRDDWRNRPLHLKCWKEEIEESKKKNKIRNLKDIFKEVEEYFKN
jgi:hypothetical protein